MNNYYLHPQSIYMPFYLSQVGLFAIVFDHLLTDLCGQGRSRSRDRSCKFGKFAETTWREDKDR